MSKNIKFNNSEFSKRVCFRGMALTSAAYFTLVRADSFCWQRVRTGFDNRNVINRSCVKDQNQQKTATTAQNKTIHTALW